MGRATGASHTAAIAARRGGSEPTPTDETRQPSHRRGPYRWRKEVLEAELAQFLNGRSDRPTGREFEDAGRGDLLDAIRSYGGTQYWAGRMNCTLGVRQGPPYGPEDALEDARRANEEFGYFPNIIALRKTGYPRLASHITHARGGSVKRFCGVHGITYRRARTPAEVALAP